MVFIVEQEEISVKEYLTRKQNISHRLLVRLKQSGGIFCNGKNVWVRHICRRGDRLELQFAPEVSEGVPQENIPLDILYEDEALLAINKPPGMPPHPSYKHAQGTVAGAVAGYYARNGVQTQVRALGRLDRNTSGVMVFGKNPFVQDRMIDRQRGGDIQKVYLAVAEGNFSQTEGTVEAPIGRKEGSMIERCVTESGKAAQTRYEVLCQREGHALLKLYPLTGRTHQLRVHMAYLGHPLAGDTLYGGSGAQIARHALHAYELHLPHPLMGKMLCLQAPLPQDMRILIDKTGLVW